MDEIERYYAMQARNRAIMGIPEAIRRQQAVTATMEALDRMMQAVIRADLDGDITKADTVIEPLATAFGVKLHGKRRKA